MSPSAARLLRYSRNIPNAWCTFSSMDPRDVAAYGEMKAAGEIETRRHEGRTEWRAAVNAPTLVLFRVYKDDSYEVVAIFPEVEHAPGFVTGYSHFGQHFGCQRGHVVDMTRPATPEEYAALARELRAEPYRYNLKVGKRWPARG